MVDPRAKGGSSLLQQPAGRATTLHPPFSQTHHIPSRRGEVRHGRPGGYHRGSHRLGHGPWRRPRERDVWKGPDRLSRPPKLRVRQCVNAGQLGRSQAVPGSISGGRSKKGNERSRGRKVRIPAEGGQVYYHCVIPISRLAETNGGHPPRGVTPGAPRVAQGAPLALPPPPRAAGNEQPRPPSAVKGGHLLRVEPVGDGTGAGAPRFGRLPAGEAEPVRPTPKPLPAAGRGWSPPRRGESQRGGRRGRAAAATRWHAARQWRP